MDRFKVMLEDNVYLSRQQERGSHVESKASHGRK